MNQKKRPLLAFFQSSSIEDTKISVEDPAIRFSRDLAIRLNTTLETLPSTKTDSGKFSHPSDSVLTELISRGNDRCNPVELLVVSGETSLFYDSFFSESFAERIIRSVRRPVIFIGPRAREYESVSFDPSTSLRLLVSTDLGRSSRPAEHYALSLARRTGAQVTLLHNPRDSIRTMEESAIQSGMVPLEFNDLEEQAFDTARTLLFRRVAFFQHCGVSASGILDTEPCFPVDSISRHLSSPSLVLLGSRSRNHLWNLLNGSHLHRALLSLPVPVLAIRGG